MDLLGYAALGGLERLTIVAGAVIIGYWGYRLYTAEKSAGLIFMGLAVVVLVGALATGGSYLRSVGEGYQLASLPADELTQESPFVDATVTGQAGTQTEAPAPEPATTVAATAGEQTAADAEAIVDAPASQAIEPSVPAATSTAAVAEPAVAPTAESEPTETAPAPSMADAQESPVRLATGAELGGRIVSVKSENVSLEWSSDAAQSADANGSE